MEGTKFGAVPCREGIMMLKIKSLDGRSVLGKIKSPDDLGQPSGWLGAVLGLLGFVHHCGVLCRKVEPSTHWHSATYECRKCQARFWTWSDTG